LSALYVLFDQNLKEKDVWQKGKLGIKAAKSKHSKGSLLHLFLSLPLSSEEAKTFWPRNDNREEFLSLNKF